MSRSSRRGMERMMRSMIPSASSCGDHHRAHDPRMIPSASSRRGMERMRALSSQGVLPGRPPRAPSRMSSRTSSLGARPGRPPGCRPGRPPWMSAQGALQDVGREVRPGCSPKLLSQDAPPKASSHHGVPQGVPPDVLPGPPGHPPRAPSQGALQGRPPRAPYERPGRGSSHPRWQIRVFTELSSSLHRASASRRRRSKKLL